MALLGRADAGRDHEQKCDTPLAHESALRGLCVESNCPRPKCESGGSRCEPGRNGVSIIWMVNAALVDFVADATRSAGGPRRPNAARALCEERLT